MSKLSKKKVQDLFENWYPSNEEKKAFKKFLDPYLEMKKESVFKFQGKEKLIPAHRGYINGIQGMNQAMSDFGAVSLIPEYGTFAVKAEVFTNEFIKSVGNKNLFEKFKLLEHLYFRANDFVEQKQMEFHEEVAKTI